MEEKLHCLICHRGEGEEYKEVGGGGRREERGGGGRRKEERRKEGRRSKNKQIYQ
jgi:hypothetical protein